MPQIQDKSIGVPTNIIGGFLGTGKTSTILHLLKHKPKGERWAVLVNEFGEVGIDGTLFDAKYSEEQGVYVREVQGGCMGCVTDSQMQLELEELLAYAKPHRLLIEPTGLGHPKELLENLTDDRFFDVLSIQKIITLVDARHLLNLRYRQSESFREQIAIADVIVANKQDFYSDDDRNRINSYLRVNSIDKMKLSFTEQGVIDPESLNGSTDFVTERPNVSLRPIVQNRLLHEEGPIPKCGFIKTENQKEGYVTLGWRFSSKLGFNHQKLSAFLSGVNAQRLKATCITSSGHFAYNLARDALTEIAYERFDESRIEIIAWLPSSKWESQLFDCIDTGNVYS